MNTSASGANDASRVSVVIINFNGRSYLEASIRSVLSEKPLEVIVVDDCSTDGSDKIAAQFPVQLIRTNSNVGPTAARNAGARQAKGDFILFLDGDAECRPGYIGRLLQVFSEHNRCAVVGGQIIESYTNEPMWFRYSIPASIFSGLYVGTVHPVLNGVAQLLERGNVQMFARSWWRWLYKFGNSNLQPEPHAPIRVGWVVEIAFMVRAEVFRGVGMFDEGYWMFFEGPDLCHRIRHSGFEVWYTPHAKAVHLGGHSGSSDRRKRIHSRSQRRYAKRLIRSLALF